MCRPRGLVRPAPPARIYGNTYYVGTCGISVILITSDKGHILIDTAPAKAAPSVLANIRTLGFDPKDVKFLLTSHEHIDHVGGIAAIKAATGATLIARAEAILGLETGKVGREDPQYDIIVPFDGAKVDRVIKDGEVLRLGPIAITAIATPGHTMGGPAGVEELRRQEMPVHRLCRQHQRGVSGRLPVQRSSRLDRGVPLNL